MGIKKIEIMMRCKKKNERKQSSKQLWQVPRETVGSEGSFCYLYRPSRRGKLF